MLEDVFDLQDQIATNVAGIIEPALQAAEIRRSAGRPTSDLTAYDLYLRALAAYFPIAQRRIAAALELLNRAIEIDPNYGPALSWAAVYHWQCVTDGWAEHPEVGRSKAVDLARRALDATQNDPGVLANVSFVLANFGADIGAMIGMVDRALELNPSFARGWNVSGLLRRKRCESTVGIGAGGVSAYSSVQAHGSDWARRRLGQLLTSLVSTSVK